MERENLIPETPDGLLDIDRSNFIRHFSERNQVEKRAYGDLDDSIFEGHNVFKCTRKTLNSFTTASKVSEFNPDICFIFGPAIIKKPLFEQLPEFKFNLHLGLSPTYKGSATLFWPFFMLEPQFAGVTFHQISNKADAGDIIHQQCPILYEEDGIHDVAARCVTDAAITAYEILSIFLRQKSLQTTQQRSSGKLWLSTDFHPYHLRLVYNTFDNDIVFHYLNGSLSDSKPDLIKLI